LLTEWTANDLVMFRGIFASRDDENWTPIDFDSLPSGRIGSINRLFWNSAKYQWLQIGAVFGRYGCGSIGIPPPVCRKPCPPPPK
jgi:hypothetical protein